MKLTINKEGVFLDEKEFRPSGTFQVFSEVEDGRIVFKVEVMSSIFDDKGREYCRVDIYKLDNLEVSADMVL